MMSDWLFRIKKNPTLSQQSGNICSWYTGVLFNQYVLCAVAVEPAGIDSITIYVVGLKPDSLNCWIGGLLYHCLFAITAKPTGGVVYQGLTQDHAK